MGLSLTNRLCLCQAYVYIYTIYKSSVSTGFAKQIMSILRILCFNGSLVIWTVVSLTAAKFKHIFCLASLCPPLPRYVFTEPSPSNGHFSGFKPLGHDMFSDTFNGCHTDKINEFKNTGTRFWCACFQERVPLSTTCNPLLLNTRWRNP
jgi:hypothetical protein